MGLEKDIVAVKTELFRAQVNDTLGGTGNVQSTARDPRKTIPRIS